VKPNKCGCRVSQDVCIIHDEPLVCEHGCEQARPHKCTHAFPCSYCDKMINLVDAQDRERKRHPERTAWVVNTENALCEKCEEALCQKK
jgi:hypothetical protein